MIEYVNVNVNVNDPGPRSHLPFVVFAPVKDFLISKSQQLALAVCIKYLGT